MSGHTRTIDDVDPPRPIGILEESSIDVYREAARPVLIPLDGIITVTLTLSGVPGGAGGDVVTTLYLG